MSEPPSDASSPLEQMLERWFDDRQAGQEMPASRYLELFSQLQEACGEGVDAQGRPSQRLGPYELIEELGRGGQGAVWRAKDTRLNRQVAVKVLSTPGSSLHLERFFREAEIASRLDHPGICAVYDTGTEDGVPYIAMRLVDGVSLATRIREADAAGEGDLPTLLLTDLSDASDGTEPDAEASSRTPSTRHDLGEVLQLIEDAARALHAAHEAGIVHRDIKPGNVMVTSDNRPVLLDFGLARDDEGEGPTLTQTGDLFGTPAYMSPEQVRRQRLDRRTDVWSLGAMLYECLTLRRPFHASTRHDLNHAILNHEPPDPRRYNRAVSRDLGVVVATALEKDLSRRYQTAGELADDLRRVRERRPVSARPVGPHVRFLRWVQRNPALAFLVIAAFALLAGLLVNVWASLNRYRALEDGSRARDLVVEADSLWPARPETVAAMESWLARARDVLLTLPGHEEELRDLLDADDSLGDVRIRRELYGTMVNSLRELRKQVVEVEQRLDVARLARQRSIDDHRELWSATVAAISSSAVYGGLEITPQVGLVPLGSDPASGRFEFAHLPSGSRPVRSEDGRLRLTEDAGLVLVLIPPSVVNGKALPAYFISKYEMTQAQWLRFTGTNPSIYRPGGQPATTLLHPVESVTHAECMRVCGQLDLDLPTEIQWEHAARGGKTTPFWCGGLESANANGNLADRSYRAHRGSGPLRHHDDGFPVHAPVDAFAANPFGIHGVIGNVTEWCKNTADGTRKFAARGGAYKFSPTNSHHGKRFDFDDHRSDWLGLRPVRAVETQP